MSIHIWWKHNLAQNLFLNKRLWVSDEVYQSFYASDYSVGHTGCKVGYLHGISGSGFCVDSLLELSGINSSSHALLASQSAVLFVHWLCVSSLFASLLNFSCWTLCLCICFCTTGTKMERLLGPIAKARAQIVSNCKSKMKNVSNFDITKWARTILILQFDYPDEH